MTEQWQKSFGCGKPEDTFSNLAQALGKTPYICGERFTAADVYVGSHIGFGMQFGGLPKLPEFVAYWERISQRPAKLKADEIDNALMVAAQ